MAVVYVEDLMCFELCDRILVLCDGGHGIVDERVPQKRDRINDDGGRRRCDEWLRQ